MTSVHPRACGEHAIGMPLMIAWSGSSPRLRGTQPVDHAVSNGQRFIPAPAGNTEATVASRRVSAVHPRACGEHLSGATSSATNAGSSPRLRGTRVGPRAAPASHRFIPAPAGNTDHLHVGMVIFPVHPRACGEHDSTHATARMPTGSSPRLRGTPSLSSHPNPGARFIPAPAGNTGPAISSIRARTVHPRACGEHPDQ